MAVQQWVKEQRNAIESVAGREVLDALVAAAESDDRYELRHTLGGNAKMDLKYHWRAKPHRAATITIRLNKHVGPLAYLQQPATADTQRFWTERGMYKSVTGRKVVVRLNSQMNVSEFLGLR